jgi:hypothetical protein
MMGMPHSVRIWLACGATDMRCGFDGLAAMVQTRLPADPYAGHLFVFRGRRGNRLKTIWYSGDGHDRIGERRAVDLVARDRLAASETHDAASEPPPGAAPHQRTPCDDSTE